MVAALDNVDGIIIRAGLNRGILSGDFNRIVTRARLQERALRKFDNVRAGAANKRIVYRKPDNFKVICIVNDLVDAGIF